MPSNPKDSRVSPEIGYNSPSSASHCASEKILQVETSERRSDSTPKDDILRGGTALGLQGMSNTVITFTSGWIS